jgi:hypothetical protein
MHSSDPSSLARRRLPRFAAMLALLGTAWAIPVMAAAGPSPTRWERLREHDLRVAGVAYRIAVANKQLCRAALAPQLGFVLHGIEQYAPADRAEAGRRFGLGPNPGVMGAVAGSPAQKAGLAPGDQLLSVNGRALGDAAAAASREPTRAYVERAQRILVEEMAKGAVTLRVSRAGNDYDLRFAAETGCRTNVELAAGETVNAWADGVRIVVSDGILERCATDADLALVIGHELAHNLLHHDRTAAGAAARPMSLLSSQGSAKMREDEEDADRLGVRLAAGAAYDLDGVEAFLGGLLQSGDAVPRAASHPEPGRRLALLRAEIAALRGRKAA